VGGLEFNLFVHVCLVYSVCFPCFVEGKCGLLAAGCGETVGEGVYCSLHPYFFFFFFSYVLTYQTTFFFRLLAAGEEWAGKEWTFHLCNNQWKISAGKKLNCAAQCPDRS